MNQKVISKISKSVYKQFPEVTGSSPKVKQRSQAKSIDAIPTYVLTYHSVSRDKNGRKFPRQIRVVAHSNGKILRMSTSR